MAAGTRPYRSRLLYRVPEPLRGAGESRCAQSPRCFGYSKTLVRPAVPLEHTETGGPAPGCCGLNLTDRRTQ